MVAKRFEKAEKAVKRCNTSGTAAKPQLELEKSSRAEHDRLPVSFAESDAQDHKATQTVPDTSTSGEERHFPEPLPAGVRELVKELRSIRERQHGQLTDAVHDQGNRIEHVARAVVTGLEMDAVVGQLDEMLADTCEDDQDGSSSYYSPPQSASYCQ